MRRFKLTTRHLTEERFKYNRELYNLYKDSASSQHSRSKRTQPNEKHSKVLQCTQYHLTTVKVIMLSAQIRYAVGMRYWHRYGTVELGVGTATGKNVKTCHREATRTNHLRLYGYGWITLPIATVNSTKEWKDTQSCAPSAMSLLARTLITLHNSFSDHCHSVGPLGTIHITHIDTLRMGPWYSNVHLRQWCSVWSLLKCHTTCARCFTRSNYWHSNKGERVNTFRKTILRTSLYQNFYCCAFYGYKESYSQARTLYDPSSLGTR